MKYKLTDTENVFSMTSYVSRALREQGLDAEADKMLKEAVSGDKENLIAVCDKYLDMANKAAFTVVK